MARRIGGGRLYVFDISRPADPQILGRIDGLGNTRQIAVEAGVAYVTSREHGVYMVDVRAPRTPELLSHYDGIEVATGVDVSGDVLAVACRLHGVEFVDVSDPAAPKRVFRDTGHGFLYHIGEDVIDDRAVCVLWQLGGLRWYDIYGGLGPKFSGDQYPFRLGGDGTVALGGDRFVVARGGLLRIKRGELRPPEELSTYRVESRRLKGRPRRQDGLVYLADRRAGDVTVVNVSNPERPELVEALNVSGNPASVTLHRGLMVIPNGYEGLWVEKGK